MNDMMYKQQCHFESEHFGRVAVLYGGLSAEREVSLRSGEAVISGLQSIGIDVVGVDVGSNVIEQLRAIDCDRVFIALHGGCGEDGKIQALLEWLGLPYSGSNVGASALALNKYRTKLAWVGVGLPTPAFQLLQTDSDWQTVLSRLGGECFVKPVNEGSSIGMDFALSAEALQKAYSNASKFDHEVMVEKRIVGPEFTVGVLNGRALPSIQLKAKNSFYDYEAKYESSETEYLCPSGLDAESEAHLQALALKAFDVIGCRGWGRVDFMQDQEGNFYLLEVNTVPGMTSQSLMPMAANTAGLSFPGLLKEILLTTFSSSSNNE